VLGLLPAVSRAQLPGEAVNQVDFVFLIDASPSMADNINGVRNGLTAFVNDLTANDVDAAFAIVLFGKTGPELMLDLTTDSSAAITAFGNIVTNDANPGIHDNHNGDPEDALAAIRAALGASVTELNNANIPGDGIIDFRDGSLINLILMTDENSDRPFHVADRLPGQLSEEPLTQESSFQESDWQVEVDNTAAAIIAEGAFLNMLISPCQACKLQFGDPDADVSDPDLGNWDEDETLLNLQSGDSTSEFSLQAQVIAGALVARTFNISRVAEDGFVTNFFAAKLEETLLPICGDGEITGDEECDDSNTANGDCCSSSCVFEDVDTPCTDDADACTTDVCDGAGTCDHNAITCDSDDDPCTADTCDAVEGCNYPAASDGTPFDDGLYCTTTDECTAGTCTGSGDACSGAGECQATCSEGVESAVCADPNGTPCTSDADVCTDDICDGSGSCIHPNNSAPCDDGDECTVGDFCLDGSCQPGPDPNDCDDDDDCTIDMCTDGVGCEHENIQFFSACFGAIIAGDGDKKGQARVRAAAQALGDVCGDLGDLGQQTFTEGTWYARDDANKKTVKVRGNEAVVGEDLVTGGGTVRAAPAKKNADIFETGLIEVTGGNMVDMPSAGTIDTTGTDPRLGDCNEAQLNQVPVATLLDNLAGDQGNLGKLQTQVQSTETFLASNVGGITVIDIDKWTIGNFATVVIDGGGDSSFVFRIGKKLDSNASVEWQFVNGAAPERTIFYVAGGKLEIGQKNTGGGVLFCPNGKVTVRAGSVWDGAMVAGKKADLRDDAVLNHIHYTGPNF
jgi:hypothetical protein